MNLFFPSIDSGTSNQIDMIIKPVIDYLPRRLDSKRSLVITTRNRQFGEDLSNGESCIEVGPFALQEARTLLRRKAGTIADGSAPPPPSRMPSKPKLIRQLYQHRLAAWDPREPQNNRRDDLNPHSSPERWQPSIVREYPSARA
jgi:hypothetical protein